MNADLETGIEVTLSRNCHWHIDSPGPWNPKGEVGKIATKIGDFVRTNWWTYPDSVCYDLEASDLIPMEPISSRRVARDAARFSGLTVVDFGVEAGTKRWQVASKEI